MKGKKTSGGALGADQAPPHGPIHRVVQLDLDELEDGMIHRVNLELVADGLGNDMLIPIIVAKGRRPGPVYGITAAVHGNELNGIAVIHDVFSRLDPRHLRGTIVGVVCVNLPGLHRHQRQFYGQFDLNHLFPGRADGNIAEVYANRLLTRIVDNFDRLIDLHTASFGRVNSLYVRADLKDPRTKKMAFLQRPEIIVHNPPSDHTLRGAAMERGIPAITVEIGDPQRFQTRYIHHARQGLRALFSDLGMIPARAPSAERAAPVICTRSRWLYADRGGLLDVLVRPTDLVSEGQEIAVLRNAFGDITRRYYAPHDGIIIGNSVNPVGATGSRIVHIGEIAPPDHPFSQPPT